jgi:cAMP phosphodiesterase
MQLRVLGCNGGIGKGLRSTSYLLNDTILLDGGSGIGDLSLDEMLSIRHVILTHAHLDHVSGLALMIASIYDDMKHAITIYAPPQVLLVLKISLFNWQLWPDFTELPDDANPCVRLHAVEQNSQFQINDEISIYPVILSHTVESFAYIITSTNTNLCFFGDTGPTENIWQTLNKLERVDHVLIECSFPNESDILAMQSGHYTPKLLAEDLKQLNHSPIIHVHHIKPGCVEMVIKQCRETLTEHRLNIVELDSVLTLAHGKY